mmetsp:Transcript_10020/g.24793  ORF Transcript_10020/g.24793 Transcript_10020/m.24793 type:complete len:82 (-) Transcript_10020:321-566(-)
MAMEGAMDRHSHKWSAEKDPLRCATEIDRHCSSYTQFQHSHVRTGLDWREYWVEIESRKWRARSQQLDRGQLANDLYKHHM